MTTVGLRPLHRDDLPAARELLAGAELATEDIDDSTITFVGAFADGALAGVVGLQTCGPLGLLRSLAVAPPHRARGIARQLCERVFDVTAERRLESLWLLTTSAKDYFARLGFEAVPRDQVPDAIRATAQFSSLCPASAQVMRRVSSSATSRASS